MEAHEAGVPKNVRTTVQLVQMLREKYPAHKWDRMFTMKGRFGQQRRLEQAVATIFPVRTLSNKISLQLMLLI